MHQGADQQAALRRELAQILFLAMTTPGASPPLPWPTPRSSWAELAELAVREGLGGLLLRATRQTGVVLPEEIHSLLHRTATATFARNLLLLRDAGRLARVLGELGIPALFLKGTALLEQVYPDPADRAMFDVDLLVREQDADRTRAAARALGYRHVAPDRAPSRQRRTKQDLVRREGEHLLRLEIQTHLDGLGHRGGDVGALLGRGRLARVGGVEARIPSPEDLALHLAIHWTTEGFPHRLRDSIDLLALWRRDGLDLQEVRARAGRVRASLSWDELHRRAAAEIPGLPAPPPLRGLRRGQLALLSLPPALRALLPLLLAEDPGDAALLASRVVGRRLLDRWAALFEGTLLR